jgi:hypothetical protein
LQLDESCLNALPEDMQIEIKEAYELQQQQQQNLQCLNDVLKSPKKSSPRGKSPRKSSPSIKGRSPGKYSPHFKVPRGRPGRGRPRKLEFRQRGQPMIVASIAGRQVSSTLLILTNIFMIESLWVFLIPYKSWTFSS